MRWWIGEYLQNGEHVLLISQIFWVLFSITMHELAHGWAALWQGDNTPRALNRLTLNPLVHMGGWSLVMFAIVGIAWGVMPIDPSRFRWGRRGRIVVAGAGPAMNLALALAALILLTLWLWLGPQSQPIYQHLTTFFFLGIALNLVLAAFNLLPVPPLDGSEILAGISMRWYRLYQQGNLQMIGMFIVLALLISGGFSYLFSVAFLVTALLTDAAGAIFGNPDVMRVIWGG